MPTTASNVLDIARLVNFVQSQNAKAECQPLRRLRELVTKHHLEESKRQSGMPTTASPPYLAGWFPRIMCQNAKAECQPLRGELQLQ